MSHTVRVKTKHKDTKSEILTGTDTALVARLVRRRYLSIWNIATAGAIVGEWVTNSWVHSDQLLCER